MLVACSGSEETSAASAGGAGGAAAGAAGAMAGAGTGGDAGTGGTSSVVAYGPPTTFAQGLRRPARTVAFDHYVVASQAAGQGGVYVYDLASGAGKDHALNAIVSVLLPRPSGDVWYAERLSLNGSVVTLNPGTLAETLLFDTPLSPPTDMFDGGTVLGLVGDQGTVEVRDMKTFALLYSANVGGAQTGAFFNGLVHVPDPVNGRIWRVEGPTGNAKVWHKGLTNPHPIEVAGSSLLVGELIEQGRLVRLTGDATGAQEEVVATGLSFPLRIVARGDDIFWAESGHCDSNPPVADGKIVWRKADGTLVTLADGQRCARGLSVSPKGVFWLVWDSDFLGSLRGVTPM